MRARRGLPMIAIGGLAAGLLSGCVPNDGRNYSNATDVSRAHRVWSDPWLANEAPSVAGPSAFGSSFKRGVAGRGYTTPVAPLTIATTEVRAAITAGWRLVGAQCDRNEKGSLIDVNAQLARGSQLDDWSLATIEAATHSDASGSPPTNPAPTYTQVSVGALVPHHLDTAWPDAPAMELEASCLLQDPSTTPASPGPSSTPPVEPTIGRLSGDRTDPPTWSDDAEGDLRAGVDALTNDQGLKSLGLVVAMPAAHEDSEARDAAMGSAKDVAATGGLASSVSSLGAQGWTLTYAACIGPGAPNVAELSRPAGKRTAVLRLSQVAAPAESSVDATVVVSTPGYSPPTPAGITGSCFDSTTAPTTFSHKGVPSLGPTRMFPLQR
ncbi:hypothetical protein ACOCJ7_09490 [Knoellia sp. CPCC 206453]|uniref:hypothetical protein n=1 Tax=Knoellia pratensis TaxID=3404796 RepID=UPI003620CC29